MSFSARAPLRLPLWLVVPIIGFCAALIIWLISFSPWRIVPFGWAGQAYLLLALVLAFRYWPPMIRWVMSMPAVHRVMFAVLLGAMVAGHFRINGGTYYPYITWEIFPFVNETNPVVVPEFIGTTANGRQVRLLVEQLFPSIVQFYPPNDSAQLEHLANALARVYNEHHADDPVRRVDLMLMSVELHPPADQSRNEPSCELLNSYDVSSDR